LSQLEDVFVR